MAVIASSRPRILVIDDEVDLRGMLEFALGEQGYEVIQAQDGEEGLNMARREAVDLIICDIRMPRLDGVETARVLRQELPGIPIIMVTGLLSDEPQEACFRAGVAAFLRKPFSLQELSEIIQRQLASRT